MSLTLEHVSRTVEGQTWIDDASLKFEPGSFNVLLGRTLSGKTSLMRLMAGLDKPDSGRISFDVLVPKDRVTRLRMKLAEGGLPKGGGVGYEIFDKGDSLSATNFVQNINLYQTNVCRVKRYWSAFAALELSL